MNKITRKPFPGRRPEVPARDVPAEFDPVGWPFLAVSAVIAYFIAHWVG